MSEQLALDLAGFGADRSAVISECGLYRYRLERRWAPGFTVCWVMLMYLRGDLTPKPWSVPA